MSDIIDMHVHFGAPAGVGSPCYWSKKFEKSIAFFAMRVMTGMLFRKVTFQLVEKKMLKVIRKSKKVDKCVLLALDEVYIAGEDDARGDFTHLFTPNSYLAQLAKDNEKILFGASVHPYRKDWEEQLDFCIENGAVLCKWLPSSQLINPADERCIPFYKKLVEYKLPLLCHVGPEEAIPTSNEEYNKYNNPTYLTTALDMGVTVIAAHCAMPFWDTPGQDVDFKELRSMIRQADEKGWNLYADLSALCVPMRAPYVKKVKEQFPPERLIFGSDYPIPMTEFSYNASPNLFNRIGLFFKGMFTKNLLDKNFYLVEGMKFGDAAFENAHKILRL